MNSIGLTVCHSIRILRDRVSFFFVVIVGSVAHKHRHTHQIVYETVFTHVLFRSSQILFCFHCILNSLCVAGKTNESFSITVSKHQCVQRRLFHARFHSMDISILLSVALFSHHTSIDSIFERVFVTLCGCATQIMHF